MKDRIAIVVQRCHESIVGGSEALAWQYAELLERDFAVDVLTSAASSYVTWENDLPVGAERRGDIRTLRFEVARGRTPYFHDLHARLLAAFAQEAGGRTLRERWPEALQEEFIRAQGPICPGLIEHLAENGDDYAAVLFLTYLYPTTFDGCRALEHQRWALIPTLHDEPPAYLPVFARMAHRAGRILWNARAEQRLGRTLWDLDRGGIVAMTVATDPVAPAREASPYLLYCGRIDENKGCADLLRGFASFKNKHRSPLRLVMTGVDHIGVRGIADVDYLGFVDEARKLALMAGATAFVHPSPYESLSIVVLEAMAQGTPIIVNGRCEVLADHVADSASGFVYRTEDELHDAILTAAALAGTEREEQSRRARAYVLENYARAAVRRRLVAEIESLRAMR
jgi:glycosyltransferase involved in cell wall biosynthesis